MPQQSVKLTPTQVMNFTFDYFHNAVRKSKVGSKQQVTQMRSEELRLTPQDVGNFARRISISSQFSKSPQKRFIDLMA